MPKVVLDSQSTFVNLILGLYELTDGRILIDGQNITGVKNSSLREAITMIPQDLSLFHRLLMDNICYGGSDASDASDASGDMVIAAAKKAHAREFISQILEGYDTQVGDH